MKEDEKKRNIDSAYWLFHSNRSQMKTIKGKSQRAKRISKKYKLFQKAHISNWTFEQKLKIKILNAKKNKSKK